MIRNVKVVGDAILYLADCRDVFEQLPALHADCFITDPPYGVNLGKHGAANEKRPQWLAKKAYESYDDTEENLIKTVIPVIEYALRITDRGLVFCADKNIWHFPRANTIGGVYMPAACGRNGWGFASMAHCLFYGTAPDLHKGAKHTVLRSTDRAEDSEHPCPKPLGWMKWAIDLVSRRDETILDPFMGSGTTGVAAMQLGRKFIGIEIEPKYFDIACERIENAQRQQKLFGDAA